jgi:hypothetical protein
MTSLLKLPLALVAVLFATGCSFSASIGSDTLDGKEVAAEVEKQFRALPDVADGTMECPDLKDEVGEEVRCVRTVEGDGVRAELGVTVTVVEPDSDGNNLDFQADDEPTSVTVLADSLNDYITGQIEGEYGVAPSAIDCPELLGEVGNEATCTLTVEGDDYEAVITVTGVEGTEVAFDFSIGSPAA